MIASGLVAWEHLDTVLVDMDGTLLDLAFDNFFWRQVVPLDFARLHDIGIEEATREVYARYEFLQGRLEWYCLDHWTRDLGLDLRSLKFRHRHRIRYLPRAPDFLAGVRRREKRVVLVTNAHPDTLALKVEQTCLDRHVDRMISSHDLGAPKESREFWAKLQQVEAFDTERSMLIEDSLPVLESARDFGLGTTLAVRQPDSEQPARDAPGFAAVLGVRELV